MGVNHQIGGVYQVLISDQVFILLYGSFGGHMEELLSGWKHLLRFQTRCLSESGNYLKK